MEDTPNIPLDEDLMDLERQLLDLSPAPVSPDFENRIFEALGAEADLENTIVPFPLWQKLGAAAAVLVASAGVYFAALNNFGPRGGVASPTPPPLPTSVGGSGAATGKHFVPASADNTLRGVADGGVFMNADGKPVRELRYQFSDTYRWTDQRDGTELEVTIPRERSYLVPVRTD